MQAKEYALEDGCECESNKRGEQDGEGEPCGERVPLPGPEHLYGGPIMGPDGAHESVAVERFVGCVEETISHAHEDDNQGELQGKEQVVDDLGGDYVEAEEERGGEAQEGGATDDGIDADGGGDGDRPG